MTLNLMPHSYIQSENLEQVHAGSVGGHLGQSKTPQKLKDQFYWPSHNNDVVRWYSLCSSSATRKSQSPKQRLHSSLLL